MIPTQIDNTMHVEKLIQILARLKLNADHVAGTLNVVQGRGPTATKANLDVDELMQRLDGLSDEQVNRKIWGYAQGVQTALSEPKPRLRAVAEAKEQSFADVAGRLMPNYHVDTFALGASHASSDEAWIRPFVDDIILTYVIELDRGYRVLSRQQVSSWGVTADRISGAARSMLYHRSRNLQPKPVEGEPAVYQIHRGDGYDAVRLTVIEDLFFGDVDEHYRFALPHEDWLLFTQGDSERDYQALDQATRVLGGRLDYLLSDRIFALQSGTPVAIENA